LACGYDGAGRGGEARGLLARLEQISKDTYVSPYLFGLVHTCLRDFETHSNGWNEGYAEKNPVLAILRVDPLLDALRTDLRFQS
jgi:hypothetical protein